MPKIQLFHDTKPKNEVFSVMEVRPFIPSNNVIIINIFIFRYKVGIE